MPKQAKDGLAKFTRDPQSIARVADEIVKREFNWWLKRTKRREALEELRKATGLRIPAALLRDFVRGKDQAGVEMPKVFRWYSEVYRAPTCYTRELDHKGWEKLRAAVKEADAHIRGRGIEVAVAIVSVEYPCNERLLEGLNRDLHIWEPPKDSEKSPEQAPNLPPDPALRS